MFHAEIEATNHCNTRCLHCPHEAMTRPRGRMEWETFETIIRKIRAYVKGERFSLSFSGMGEPLLNPNLPRFIQHVSGDAFTAFACNGLALTEQNARKLREAGLDVIYLSFNGDEPEVYGRMMGGIPFERTLANLRRAVGIARDSRLDIRANVSVARANSERTTRIKDLLNREGVSNITFSLCHNRGGNLRDPAVCDTPPIPEAQDRCAVIQHTLFIDWRGQALICDHDLHGEYPLGDLLTEPLGTIQERRQALIEKGVTFKMCAQCNDLLKMGFHPLGHPAGGIISDWVYDLHRDADTAPLPEANPAMRWLYQLYAKEDRVDRLVNRLLKVDRETSGRLAQAESEITDLHTTVHQKNLHLLDLQRQLEELRASRGWRMLERLRRVHTALLRQAGRDPSQMPGESPGQTI